VNVSLDVNTVQGRTALASYDVVVLGAGPYGLSATAHMRARGLNVAVFGKPIGFWREHMPKGMQLRSYWWATNLSDPEGRYQLKDYFLLKGKREPEILPIQDFVDYSLWFQQNVVPDVDETLIQRISKVGSLFKVQLEDGRVLFARAVVMAPGLQYFVYYPKEYQGLPASLVSHSADHHDMAEFKGKRVIVVGRGQGALETAALLNENGATVQLLARRSVHWISGTGHGSLPPVLRQLRAPDSALGGGWLNVFLEKLPYSLQRFPRDIVDYIVDTKHGPKGAPWLKPRILGKVEMLEHQYVDAVEPLGETVRVQLASGRQLEADHILLGTGYKTNLKRLTMLAPELLQEIHTYQGAPVLNPWFESGVTGLYFIGFSSVRSFGPLYRFVLGADAAARRLAVAVPRYVRAL
jgi:cation diffusion facilitator CzcD-associated flavoprotein CzcO